MKPKALMLLAVAIGCGLVAMLGVQQAMQGSQKEVVIETRSILVALKDIRPGEPLTEENVVMKELPVPALLTYGEDLVANPEDYLERALMISAVAGDPIRKSKLGEKGAFSASHQIPKGMRINTFPVTDSQTHSGMLKPGDRVDLKVTFNGRRGMELRTLLEYVEVFACEDKTVKSEDNKNQQQRARFVTLLVTPEQDGYIEIAKIKGQLSLSLRNPEDDELVNANGLDANALDELKHAISKGDVPDYDRYSDEDESNHRNQESAAPLADVSATDPLGSAPPVDPAGAGVQGFLQQGPAAAPVAVVPEVKKWKMTVYTGNDPVSVELDDAPAKKVDKDLGLKGVKDLPINVDKLLPTDPKAKLDDNGLPVDAHGNPTLNVDVKDAGPDSNDLQVEVDDIPLDEKAAPQAQGIPDLLKKLWSSDKN